MKNRRIASRKEIEEASPNLTPLIDVVFVVLIMFILVAPLLELDNVQLAYARQKEGKDSHQSSSLAIYVREDNSIWVQNKKVSLAQLGTLLKQEKSRSPKQIPQLFHDKKAFFGTYQAVKNVVEEAGFEQMDVILKPS